MNEKDALIFAYLIEISNKLKISADIIHNTKDRILKNKSNKGLINND